MVKNKMTQIYSSSFFFFLKASLNFIFDIASNSVLGMSVATLLCQCLNKKAILLLLLVPL